MIFKNVQVLIYVFDVEKEGKELEDDMRDYGNPKFIKLFSKPDGIYPDP